MNFDTLNKLSLEELTALFNEAFAEYFVKIELTPGILGEKIASEDICLELSVGMFDNGKPVGFMLHGIRERAGKKIAYNAGTGVIKAYRGQNATVKMYEHQIPILKENGVSEIELEVIGENIQAIKSYEKAGFKKTADLDCFKGNPIKVETEIPVTIKEICSPDLVAFQKLWNWQPTWQNATETLQKLASFKTFGAFVNDEFAGYISGNVQRARVFQFAVAPVFRNKKIGNALFSYFTYTSGAAINVNNIDDLTQQTQTFLKKIGLEYVLSQHKMNLKI